MEQVKGEKDPQSGKVYTNQELKDKFGIDRRALAHMKSEQLEATFDMAMDAFYAWLVNVPRENRFVELIRLLDKVHEAREKAFGKDDVFPDGVLTEYMRIIERHIADNFK